MCLLAALREWCEAFGMSVNVRKSEVLHFHPSPAVRETARGWLKVSMRRVVGDAIQVQEMKWVERTRYLGLHYGSERAFESCTDELFEAGQRAMFALIRKLRRKGLMIPRIALRCFTTQIRSILSYGAQVWGPLFILQLVEGRPDINGRSCYFEKSLGNRMVALQKRFLRILAGVGLAPDRLLFREFGQQPMHTHWAALIYRFWNKLVKAEGSIHHNVLREEIRIALRSNLSYKGWGSQVLKGLTSLGYDFGIPPELGLEEQVDIISKRELNIGSILHTLDQRFDDDWANFRLRTPPREFVSDGNKPGVKMCRYTHWMGTPTHMQGYIPAKVYASLLRFRLCIWGLEVNRPHGRAREDRWCLACGDRQAIEDERHVLMECPAYSGLRDELWGMGITPNATMLQVMSVEDQRGLASVLHRIRNHRTAITGIRT